MQKNIERLKLRAAYFVWKDYAKRITLITRDIEGKKAGLKKVEDIDTAREEIRHLKKVRVIYSAQAKKYKKDFRSRNRTYSMKKKGEN